MQFIKQVLSHDNMRAAWEEVSSKNGAPGIDGVSVKRWRRRWEENLYNLAESVWANTYQPSPPKCFYIPKKSGGWRKISILTVTDRVLQRAVLRIVDDFFEMSFLDCSFGYRQGRGLRDAVARIIELRDRGYWWVLDADIDDCFNQLDHDLIKKYFRQTVSDPILNRLAAQWLRAGVKTKNHKTGISMGSVISPLFCNLVLHQLDRAIVMGGWETVRYADDFCVFARSSQEIDKVYKYVNKKLHQLKLRYESRKTHLTNFDQGFVFLGVTFVGDEYSFDSNLKHIIVRGDFDKNLFVDYHPKGYT